MLWRGLETVSLSLLEEDSAIKKLFFPHPSQLVLKPSLHLTSSSTSQEYPIPSLRSHKGAPWLDFHQQGPGWYTPSFHNKKHSFVLFSAMVRYSPILSLWLSKDLHWNVAFVHCCLQMKPAYLRTKGHKVGGCREPEPRSMMEHRHCWPKAPCLVPSIKKFFNKGKNTANLK